MMMMMMMIMMLMMTMIFRNASGHIVSAATALMVWRVTVRGEYSTAELND